MRLYFPSWQALKNSQDSPKRIVISAPAKFHRRIYKAIIKEKDMDVVYKLQLSEKEIPQKAKLERESKNGMLIIRMRLSIGTEDF